MRLLGVELARLRWRRAVKLLLAACVVIPLVVLGGTVWSTRPVSAQDLAEAQAIADREAQQPYIQDQIDDCIDDPEMYFGPEIPSDLEAACVDTATPRAEWFISRQPLDLAQAVDDIGTAVPIILSVLLLLAASTFVGADWNSGSMSNQLLFEPRRTRVWAAKAGVLALAAAVTAGVVQVLFWVVLDAVARARGLDVAPAVWDQLPGIIVRGTLLAVGAALLGYSLTMLFRSTVVTLGILFGVAVASTIIISVLPLDGDNERWLLHTNVAAVVHDGTTYFNNNMNITCVQGEDGEMLCDGERTLSLLGGVGFLGTILLIPGAAGWLTFRRRDVP
jgi:ABC-2 type transport system permease protein